MFERLRATDPTQPLARIMIYRACRFVLAVLVRGLYRLRVVGAEHVPPTGGYLLVSNHQSHLDPPMIGTGLGRRNMASLARVGLFGNRLFGTLLRALGSIPVKQNEGDTGAMRAAIAELRRGRIVLIFPEGSRSPDGQVHEFKRGTWLLLSRSGADVLPAAVDGAYRIWPRDRLLPRPWGRCAVAFGKPISAASLKEMGPDAALAHLRSVIEDLRQSLHTHAPSPENARPPRGAVGAG